MNKNDLKWKHQNYEIILAKGYPQAKKRNHPISEKTIVKFDNFEAGQFNTDLLNKCVNTIIESNPNIKFFRISYDKITNSLIFISNDCLDISKWTDLQTPKSLQTMVEQIKNEDIIYLLNKEIKSQDPSKISLLSLYNFLKEIHQSYQTLKTQLIEGANSNIKDKSTWHITNFKVNGDIMSINVHNNNEKVYDNGSITIKNVGPNNWELTKVEHYIDIYEARKIFGLIYSDIISFEQQYLSYIPYFDYDKLHHLDTTSNYKVILYPYSSNHGILDVSLYANDQIYNIFTIDDDLQYQYYIDQGNILCHIVNNEENILKNVYVDIDKCPSWMQEFLKQKRKLELTEPKVDKEKVKVLENNI